MKAIIKPSTAKGIVSAPPSKSMAHRMLMGAGLANGTSIVKNIELSEDIQATLGILEALGATYQISDHVVTMHGIGGKRICSSKLLDSKESGSTLRFFIPLLLTGGKPCEFTGAKRLFERPLNIYENICKEQGIAFEKRETGLQLNGQLKAGNYQVPGNISSQFITGLLYALPLLADNSTLEIIEPIESKAYIDMTLQALHTFGIVIKQEKNTFYIAGNQTYCSKDVTVEGDYSNAAFLEAFNLVGGTVEVTGLAANSLQGDQVYQEYFKQLENTTPTLDIAECPDLGPILMGMAASLNGATFTGTKRLKIKESDRGSVMAEELKKFGIATQVFENEIIVEKGCLQKPTEILRGHNDHRIVMTMALLISQTGGEIDGCEAVRKSYPNFFDVIRTLGIQVDIQ